MNPTLRRSHKGKGGEMDQCAYYVVPVPTEGLSEQKDE
jgi:hypothetical protein